MEYIVLLLFGMLLIGVSIPNFKGNLTTIHWYNRRRVSAEDAPLYGRAIGFGTLIMGFFIALTAILQMIFELEALYYLILAGCAVGLAFILYAQFKYNKGLF